MSYLILLAFVFNISLAFEECTLFRTSGIAISDDQAHSQEYWWECIFDDGRSYRLPEDWVEEHFDEFISGATRIVLPDSFDRRKRKPQGSHLFHYFEEDETPAILPNQQVEYNQRPPQVGPRKVLVVRVTTTGLSPNPEPVTGSDSELSDIWFNDAQNTRTGTFKDQFFDCSHEQLIMNPYTDDGVVRGVVEVPLSFSSGDNPDDSQYLDRAKEYLEDNYNGAHRKADHVAYCLPEGGISGVAYAYVGGTVSVYNGKWCRSLSTLMHEVGHNLGFYHSGEGTQEYGDTSCYMGYADSRDQKPIQCFNAVWSYQSGWYLNKYSSSKYRDVSFEGVASEEKTYQVTGISNLNPTNEEIYVIKVARTGGDYFINFNLATGINRETKKVPNQVTVHTADKYSRGWDDSVRIASLDVGGAFELPSALRPNNANPVIVKFVSLSSDGEVATVKISNRGPDDDGPVVCADLSRDGQPLLDDGSNRWYDVDGEQYDCEWYSTNDRCGTYGSRYENFNYVAKEACCTCGGGKTPDVDKDPDRCADFPLGWYDKDGSTFNCEWYGAAENRCSDYGDDYANQGTTANEACCTCGGGRTGSNSLAALQSCSDTDASWVNALGLGCDWYEWGNHCAEHGDRWRPSLNGVEAAGPSANEVCCTCGGGVFLAGLNNPNREPKTIGINAAGARSPSTLLLLGLASLSMLAMAS